MNFKFTIHKLIWVLVLWQLISVGLMAVGTWPVQVAILNAALLAIFILLNKPYYSMLLLVVSIPFYVVLPNPVLENLPMWRVLFVLLFIVWFIHLLVDQRMWLMRLFEFKRSKSTTRFSGTRLQEILTNAYRRVDSRFMPWDKVAVLFFILTLLSLIIARFPTHGFKQILFLINIYIFYIVIINVVTDQSKIKELIRYTTYSLAIMVGLGFVQYIFTMFVPPYYFWQYWATLVSALYYGNPLANVLAYSNSWFSYSGGSQSLRMYGVLPDTHAFGVIAVFLLAYLVPHLNWAKRFWEKQNNRWYVLLAVFLTCFAIMANGTRGIWLAILAPLGITLIFLWKKLTPHFAKAMVFVYGLIIVLFVISPFISKGLNLIRTVDVDDNFLNRAGSIYDLNESSNVGRLEIWRNSVHFAAVHPFGVGYGNFITSIVEHIPENISYEELSARKNLRYNLPQAFVTAHSLYLQLLVELGFAGLLAFLLFWWEYFERLTRFVSKHVLGKSRYLSLTLSLGLAFVWLLAYGVFDVTILNDRVLQYLLISLAISGLIFVKHDSLTEADNLAEPNVV